MIKVLSLKRAEQRQPSRRARVHVFSTISLTVIFFTYMFTTHTFTSSHSIHSVPMITVNSFHSHEVLNNNQTLVVQQLKLTSYSTRKPVHIVQEVAQEIVLEADDHNPLVPPINLTKIESFNGSTLPELDILKSTRLSRRFEKRAQEFFRNGCKVRFFMIWISSSSFRVFGDREFIAVDALFKSNPTSCLMILSNSMDSVHGIQILKPFTDYGFRVQALTPDLLLLKNTPAQSWLHHIKKGKRNPGKIPLAQNLSNLIRLAILYKYGGVYLDTDFIVLKDFSSLHNLIGAQSATRSGNWTRLNNAVLIFDKKHPLLYKFMEEFESTFNGNKWGYNGPYLVSRVVERERAEATTFELNFTVLPPNAFYPIDWTRIGDYFTPPIDPIHQRWVETKVGQLRKLAYGVHLWNKQSSRLKIQEGSIMGRLIPDYCVICKG